MRVVKAIGVIGLFIFYLIAGVFIIGIGGTADNQSSYNFVYLIDWFFLFPLLLFLMGAFSKSPANFIKREEGIVKFSEINILGATIIGGIEVVKGLIFLLSNYELNRFIHWFSGAVIWVLILAVYLFLFFLDPSNRIVSDQE